MADFECTCSVVKGERDVAYGEDCYCWYPKPNYNECFVRCRDCKHGKRNGTICRHKRFAERETEFDIVYVEPNGFCAWGERRDDA